MPNEQPQFIKIQEYTINPVFVMVWYPVATANIVRIFFSGGRELSIDCDSAEEKAAVVTKLQSACGAAA